MAFPWCADDGLTLNAGLVALWFSRDTDQYCWEILYFCDFTGGGGGGGGSGPPVPPSGSAHVIQTENFIHVDFQTCDMSTLMHINSYLASGDFCCLLITLISQKVWAQIRTDRTLVLIWIETVWHTGSVPERIVTKELNLKKISRQQQKHAKLPIMQRANCQYIGICFSLAYILSSY